MLFLCRSYYYISGPGSINFYLSAFILPSKMCVQGRLQWGQKLCIGYFHWRLRASSRASSHSMSMELPWPGKFTSCYFWGSKHLWDSASGSRRCLHGTLSCNPPKIPSGQNHPIAQMKSERFRLVCPRPTTSKWLKWDSNVTHRTPTLRLQFDTSYRIIVSIGNTAECFEFPCGWALCLL